MLRMESETGWWLITHPDHARLAGDFAAAWGNERFRRPEPRARVLKGSHATMMVGPTRCASVDHSPREAVCVFNGTRWQVFRV